MKFKNYPRRYEYVFSDKETRDKKCNLEKVRIFNSESDFCDTSLYIKIFSKEVRDFYKDSFDHMLKLTWLSRRFIYNGNRRLSNKSNGFHADRAFAAFSRDYVNYSTKIMFSFGSAWNRIASYIEDFYPDFENNSPFECEYIYPYQYMLIPHLLVVHQMPERLELLAEGEKLKMNFSQFSDYVVNYVSCYNEENGETWKFVFKEKLPPHVIKVTKYEAKPKTRNIRSRR